MTMLGTPVFPGRSVRMRVAAVWLFGTVVAFIVVMIPRGVSVPLTEWVTRVIHVLSVR